MAGIEIDSDEALTIARVAIPLAMKNKDAIAKALKRVFRLQINKLTVNTSIYFTMYADFKLTYPIEHVNQSIYEMLQMRRSKKNQHYIKVNETVFTVYYDFTYGESFYVTNETLDYNFLDDEDNILIPSIAGIYVHLLPDDIKLVDIQNGYKLTQKIQTELLKKYDVKQMGSFVYLVGRDEKFEELVAFLDAKMRSDIVPIKNISYEQNEIKFRLNALVADRLGKVLYT